MRIIEPYTKEEKEIPMLSAYTPTKILGVWMHPDNGQTRQIVYMAEKTTQWIKSIVKSHLPPYFKLLSFRCRICAQLGYSSPIAMLTRHQFDKLFRPVLAILKHALGLPKIFSTSILFLDKNFGGCVIMKIYLKNLSSQMEIITKHVKKNDFLGRKIMIMM